VDVIHFVAFNVVLLLALFTAARLPVVTVDEDSGKLNVDVKNTVPLTIHSLPIATTFAVFEKYVIHMTRYLYLSSRCSGAFL